jgi:putative NADPH-quinone reductase
MDTKRIAIIQGHPNPEGNRYCHALAQAYIKGAEYAGHNVAVIDTANIEFPILRTQAEFEQGEVPVTIKNAQQIIQAAEHLVIVYPLWLGQMPAYFKAFFEQVFRPGFATTKITEPTLWEQPFVGKTAHIVVTMAMPALIYQWYFEEHSLKSLERNILGFCGIKTTQETLVGSVESTDDTERKQWLDKMELMGQEGK